MLTSIITILTCLTIPNLLMNYSVLQDAREKGFIPETDGNPFKSFFKNTYWIIVFEIGKIMAVAALFLIDYALLVMIRGPFEYHQYSGGDGFLGGSATSVYMNNGIGLIFMLLAPIALVSLLGWIMITKLRLHHALYLSLLIYFLIAYIAYLWIMMWDW